MKRLLIGCLAIVLALSLFGCAKAEKGSEDSQTQSSAVITDSRPSAESDTESSTPAQEFLDISVLDTNAAYSQTFAVVCDPGNYVGRLIRVRGEFSYYHDEETDKSYYVCLVKDPSSTSYAQGIEFVLGEDKQYPDDYPQEGEVFTVEGTFRTYKEDGQVYGQLANATILPTE